MKNTRIDTLYPAPRPTLSFEFFTPKTAEGTTRLTAMAEALARDFHADFLSVTYGAGGTTRDRTTALVFALAERLADRPTPVMHHLTCIGHSATELAAIVAQLREAGITNILALRGDPPKGSDQWQAHPEGFHYAWQLVRMIRDQFPECAIGVAGFPEAHPESADRQTDAAHLAEKVGHGAGFVITQLFFDCEAYFSFVQLARAAGVRVPIIPGILPITGYANLLRFAANCGAGIPESVHRIFAPLEGDDAATLAAGIEFAAAQCRSLLAGGAPGIHFYTANRDEAVRGILAALAGDGIFSRE